MSTDETPHAEPKGYLPPALHASQDAEASDSIATPPIDPVEGQRNLRMLMLKMGLVLIAMHVLFVSSFIGMGASALGGFATAQVEIKQQLTYYSWDELSSISREVSLSGSQTHAERVAQRFHLLDVDGRPFGAKVVSLSDGTKALARLVAVYEELPQGHCGLTFVLEGEFAPMPMDETVAHSWNSSYLRSWLNVELVEMMPPDLKRCIRQVAKPESADVMRTASDRIWLASVPELEVDVVGDGMGTLAHLDSTLLSDAWLRTPSTDGMGFCHVDELGYIIDSGASCDPAAMHRVVPLFAV